MCEPIEAACILAITGDRDPPELAPPELKLMKGGKKDEGGRL